MLFLSTLDRGSEGVQAPRTLPNALQASLKECNTTRGQPMALGLPLSRLNEPQHRSSQLLAVRATGWRSARLVSSTSCGSLCTLYGQFLRVAL